MEYLILLCIIPITQSRTVTNSRMPLVNNLHAPLVAELDVSNMNKELKEYIDLNIEDEVNYTCHARIQTVVNETLLELKSDMLYNYTSTLKTTKNFYDGEFAGLQKGISMQITRLVDSLTKENEEVKDNLTTENKEWKVDFKKELEQLKSEFNEFKDNMTTLLGIGLPVDCSDLIGLTNKSDVYLIHPKMLVMFKTYCDMETDGGGWTVFQRRFNGQTEFYRGWEEYKEGFGNPQAEFWMGNSKLSLMTSQRPYELRIDLEDYSGAKAFSKYSSFSIGDEFTKFKLTVAGYSGTGGDSLTYHNNQAFTTKDSDNDRYGHNCANDYNKGAWWYNNCHYSNLNGLYGNTVSNTGMSWYYWKNNSQSMKTTSMMIRRKRTR